MNPFLLFGGVFALAVASAAVITRFKASNSGLRSEEEKKRLREATMQTAERKRKGMQWLASGGLGILVVVAVVSWFSRDPASKEFGLNFAGAAALPFLVLWAKTRDDGLNPQLRKKMASQSSDPTTPAAHESRQP